MDTYTKVVLTIIALALSVIALKPYLHPTETVAFSNGPTLGDLWDTEDRRAVLEQIPLVFDPQH